MEAREHKEGRALDVEIENQSVAQSDVWKHDDFRDYELERINKLMDIHTNSIHFYNNYTGRSDLLKDYVDLTYQKVILAIDNYVNKQLDMKEENEKLEDDFLCDKECSGETKCGEQCQTCWNMEKYDY